MTPPNLKELKEHLVSRVMLPKDFDPMYPYMMHVYQTHMMMIRAMEKLFAHVLELDNKITRLKVELTQKIEAPRADNKGDPRE